MRDLSFAKKKILLLLLGGLTLSLNRSPGRYFHILSRIKKEWAVINRKKLKYEIRKLYQSELISTKCDLGGTLTLTLTEKGKQKALRYNLEKIEIPKQKWDGRWRIVVFDIPESRRDARDAFRALLKKMGFYELQKSVFIHPYECKNEIDFLIEFYNIRPYVRFITVEDIDNQLHLKRHFGLL